MQNQRSVLPSMLALPRGGTTAPTTPLLRFMIAYAQPKVNMRAKLLPYANRKADTETAAQAVRCARTAQAVRPVRAGSFAVNHSGELPLRAAGAQEGRQPAVFHPLVNLPFSLLPWVQMVDCVSRKRTRQSGYSCVSFSTFSQFTDSILLHMRFHLRRRDMSVSRNSFARCNARHLRIIIDVRLYLVASYGINRANDINICHKITPDKQKRRTENPNGNSPFSIFHSQFFSISRNTFGK